MILSRAVRDRVLVRFLSCRHRLEGRILAWQRLPAGSPAVQWERWRGLVRLYRREQAVGRDLTHEPQERANVGTLVDEWVAVARQHNRLVEHVQKWLDARTAKGILARAGDAPHWPELLAARDRLLKLVLSVPAAQSQPEGT